MAVLTLLLPVSLVELLPDHERKAGVSQVPLAAGSWADMVEEVRRRFPALAERVLTASDTVAPSYALVVNDEICQGAPVVVRPGDEISLVAIIAGGRLHRAGRKRS
jgi:molybdopterin converting factor small subunit